MSKIKIKECLDHKKLEELGYNYSIMEGGYISKDGATIVNIDRRPYRREVAQYRANVEIEHMKNVAELRQINALE